MVVVRFRPAAANSTVSSMFSSCFDSSARLCRSPRTCFGNYKHKAIHRLWYSLSHAENAPRELCTASAKALLPQSALRFESVACRIRSIGTRMCCRWRIHKRSFADTSSRCSFCSSFESFLARREWTKGTAADKLRCGNDFNCQASQEALRELFVSSLVLSNCSNRVRYVTTTERSWRGECDWNVLIWKRNRYNESVSDSRSVHESNAGVLLRVSHCIYQQNNVAIAFVQFVVGVDLCEGVV